MIITVLLPSGDKALMDVADNVLVYDGSEFTVPTVNKYVMLYTLAVSALSAPYKDTVLALQTAVQIRAMVTAIDQSSVPDTDPSLVSTPDPSEGLCICGITCAGTDLTFVAVTIDNS